MTIVDLKYNGSYPKVKFTILWCTLEVSDLPLEDTGFLTVLYPAISLGSDNSKPGLTCRLHDGNCTLEHCNLSTNGLSEIGIKYYIEFLYFKFTKKLNTPEFAECQITNNHQYKIRQYDNR